MKIIYPISKHEMEKRFAIGEIYYNYYSNVSEKHQENIFQLLISGNIEQGKKDVQFFLKKLFICRYIESLPMDKSWCVVKIDIVKSFCNLRKKQELPVLLAQG